MAQYPTNSPELEPFRKTLRNFSTPAERALWRCLEKPPTSKPEIPAAIWHR